MSVRINVTTGLVGTFFLRERPRPQKHCWSPFHLSFQRLFSSVRTGSYPSSSLVRSCPSYTVQGSPNCVLVTRSTVNKACRVRVESSPQHYMQSTVSDASELQNSFTRSFYTQPMGYTEGFLWLQPRVTPLPHVQLVIFRILDLSPFCIVYGVWVCSNWRIFKDKVAMSKRKAPQGDNPNKDICDMLMGEVNLLL